jgi:hypothetical protein
MSLKNYAEWFVNGAETNYINWFLKVV